jgi:hypothetical protein
MATGVEQVVVLRSQAVLCRRARPRPQQWIFPENNKFCQAVTSLAMICAKHLVAYQYSKSQTAETIHEKLKADFSAITLPYSRVTSWCRKLKVNHDILAARRAPGRPPQVVLDGAIPETLNKFPFHSLPRCLEFSSNFYQQSAIIW